MAVAAVVGGAVGAPFGDAFARLSKAVEEAIIKTVMFKSSLGHLRSRINRLKPFMEDIEKFYEILDRKVAATKELTKQLTKGEALVDKCLKIHRWNYLYKHKYAGKIEDLQKSIYEFFKDDLPAVMWRDQTEILAVVIDIRERQISSVGSHGTGGTYAVPNPPAGIVGMAVALKELKKELFKDEVSVLVLHASAGCGKTTLVKMLGHDREIKDKFDRIYFVPVSKTPNLKVIVQRLFDDIGGKAVEFESDEDAIHQLEQRLTKINGPKPILLILDDVWSESLLEKFEFPIPNYKILVTSRFAFPRFHYKLKSLNEKEAMELFCGLAKPQDKKPPIPDDLVSKIVKGCGRLPLALEVIGKSLCGKPVEVWRTTEKKWFNDHSILDSDERLLRCLNSSLDILDDVIKKCFMDLGSFPEDQRIPVAALIDMWGELYKLDEDEVITKLDELNKCNLASLVLTRKLFSKADPCYNEDFVTQHDLLRELAIRQSSQEPIEQREKLILDISGDNLPKWWTEQKQQSVNARLLSISTDETISSNWCIMQAPEVEVLALNFQTKNYTLPKFVDKMGKLKVLIVTNNGFFRAELSNFELLESLPNLKRIRLEKVSIPSLCKNHVPLKSLKKISLVMCSIGQAFSNYTIQISDALPKLVEINIDYCNDLELPAELCNIVHLKKLSITNCHKLCTLPEGIGKLVNLEVLRLRSCTDLLELPKSIVCLHKLHFLDISDCSNLSKFPDQIGELCNLKVLHMNGCSSFSYELPPSTLELKQLEVVVCDEEGAMLWDTVQDYLTDLTVEITENDINLNWLDDKDF